MRRIGRYTVVREIGRGGSAVVYEANDERMPRRVALKVLETADPSALARLEREARLLAKLRHPHIVAVHEFGRHDGTPFLVMDLVEGGSLARRCTSGPPSLPEALRMFEELLEAMAYAHRQGILHRDVKPANILLDSAQRVRLADFGLARSEDSVAITKSNEVFGTPLYLAPERLDGSPADLRTDVYSLGVVLYELLAGRPPFVAETIPELVGTLRGEPEEPSTDPRLNAVCRRAMHRDPARRFPSASEFLEEIRRIRRGEPTITPVTGRVSRWIGRWRRGPLLRAIGVVAVLAAVLFAAHAAHRSYRIRGHLEQARAHEAAGRWTEARASYELVLEIDAHQQEGRAGLKRVSRAETAERENRERNERENREKTEALSESMELFTAGRELLDRADRMFYELPGRLDEYRDHVVRARQRLERAALLSPDLPIVRHHLARAWVLEGWDDRAEQEWRRALEIEPGFLSARSQLADLLLRRAFFYALVGRSSREEEAKWTAEAVMHLEVIHAGSNDPAQRRLGELHRAYVRRDYATLESLAIEALREDPNRVGAEEFHFYRGVAARERGSGVAHFTRALELSPGHLRARTFRASDLLDSDPAGSVADFDVAIRIHPRVWGLHYNRACALRKLGRLEEALEALDRAEELLPRAIPVRLERASCLGELGQREEACRLVTGVLMWKPDDVTALALRAFLQLEDPDFTSGYRDLREALRIDPKDGRSWYVLGARYATEGRWDEALEAFTRSLETTPDLPEHRWARGDALVQLGRTKEALADFDRALQKDPRHVLALQSRLNVYSALGDWGRALEDCERLLVLMPENPQLHGFKGICLEARGDWTGAVRAYETALERASADWPERKDFERRLQRVRSRLKKE